MRASQGTPALSKSLCNFNGSSGGGVRGSSDGRYFAGGVLLATSDKTKGISEGVRGCATASRTKAAAIFPASSTSSAVAARDCVISTGGVTVCGVKRSLISPSLLTSSSIVLACTFI